MMSSFTKFAIIAVVAVAGVVVVSGHLSGAADAQKLPGSDVIPADRLTDWTPGVTVGVPGGIPTDRNNLIDVTKAPYNADNTGTADAQPAIMKAVTAAKDKDVVYLPAGTYRINQTIYTGAKSNITIRGDGPDKTLILPYGNTGGILVGGAWDWLWQKPDWAIAGSPKKGDTVITVGDTSALDKYPNGGIGRICRIILKNDPKLPVVAMGSWDYCRRQKSRIVAKTPTSVTIDPPLLFDLPVDLAPKMAVATQQAEFVGVEDLKFDAKNSTSGGGFVYMKQCYGCWAKNVTVLNVPNRHLWISDSLQCQFEHCFVSKRIGQGSNGAGILMASTSFSLFQDNIVAYQFAHIQMESGSSGNVVAYNYCYDSSIGGMIGVSINADHSPHNSFNLYEGNVSSKFQCDGYHGSTSHDTVFRNWLHGTNDKTDQFGICVYLNRFTRAYSVVGNVLGSPKYTYLYDNDNNGFGYNQHFIYVFGLPNMGNGGFNGKTVQLSKGIDWPDMPALRAAEPGKGPRDGFQELDLDVKATTLLKGNWNYCDKGVRASESLKGVKLPSSLYLKEKPAWFGNLNWPAFGPDTDFEKNKIPAQLRYEEMMKKGTTQ